MAGSKPPSPWPLVGYFALAYIVSWAAIVTVVGPAGLSGAVPPDRSRFVPVLFAQLAGPVLAGLGLVGYTRGTDGLRVLWRRQRRVHLEARWYVLGLLTAPVALLVVGGALWSVSPTFAPAIVTADDRLAILALAVGGGLFVAFFEELGWTGYALPTLRSRHRLLVAGVVLGLLWGAWHALPDYWGNATAYAGDWPLRIGLWIVALTAYRVLIAWLYEHTESLFLAQLAHASFVASQAVMEPTGLQPGDYLLWYGLFAVALWVVIGVIWARRAGRG